MKVVVAQEARQSLIAITRYVRQFSPVAAKRLRVQITNRIRDLQDQPRMGRKVPEYDVDSIRELLEGEYRIWYRIADDTVEVVAIFHGARDV